MISQAYFDKVTRYFDGDVKKTWEWFKEPISHFGMSPLEMIKANKHKKIIDYINKRFKDY